MACRGFEDEFEAIVAAVEPVPFGPDPASLACYPLPQLRLSGEESRARVPVVVLENGLVRATIAPGLGGRVVALSDSFSLPEAVRPEEGGPRGLRWSHGMRATLTPGSDDLAPFDHLIHSGEGSCAALLFSLVPGTPLALQVCYSLREGDRSLGVEARAFNRSLRGAPFRAVWTEGGAEAELCALSNLSPRDSRAFVHRTGQPVERSSLVCGCSAPPAYDGEPESYPLALRGAAHLSGASLAAAGGDFAEAREQTSSALSTLADDPLSWWQRAALARLTGGDGDDGALLAAHSLSPLEPMLRAEAFLATPQTHGREPSAVMRPLGDDPDAMLECVHVCCEAGLTAEASRLADECLRQRDVPLMRYLQAWLLLTFTRMEVEAANEVARASKSALAPPFAWRETEVRAVRELSARFPADERLRTLCSLLPSG